jgi:hypothetical protein
MRPQDSDSVRYREAATPSQPISNRRAPGDSILACVTIADLLVGVPGPLQLGHLLHMGHTSIHFDLVRHRQSGCLGRRGIPSLRD